MTETKQETQKPRIIMGNNELLFWTNESKEYCLHVLLDNIAENPRNWDEGGSVMYCASDLHRDYNLGDVDSRNTTPSQFWARLVEENVPKEELIKKIKSGGIKNMRREHYNETATDEEILDNFMELVMEDEIIDYAMQACEGYVAWLPLWVYIHSGITMSCGERAYPYNDKWDSGLAGWITMTRKDAMKYLQADEGNWQEKMRTLMRSEVETYDQYLRGEVYWYKLFTRTAGKYENSTDDNKDWEALDNCSGFYGSDIMENGIVDAAGRGLMQAIKSGNYQTGVAEEHRVIQYEFRKN